MKKVYYLKTCSTCQRILKELDLAAHFELQNIKTQPITASQIDEMAGLAGSYESLFSRKAMKYRSMNLGEKTLNEKDYRDLILSEYTFLKRPVVIWDDRIYVGNSSKTVAELSEDLTKLHRI